MEIGGLSETTCVLVAVIAVGGVIAAFLFYRALCQKKSRVRLRKSSASGFTEFGTMSTSDTKKCHLSAEDDDSDSDDEGFEGECVSDMPWGDDARRRICGVLDDSQWANDAAGLVPLCIDLLRSTQCLLEYLMELARERVPGKNWKLIVESADDINPLVDAVVQSMYPPLDSKVLIARATDLVVSARQLAELVVGGPPVKGLGTPRPSSSSALTSQQAANAGARHLAMSNSRTDSSSLLALPGMLRRRHGQVAKLVSAAERSLQALRMAAPCVSAHEEEATV